MSVNTSVGTSTQTRLTRNQINGFWASWGGWLLDGFNATVFALVLAPSMKALLPKSGITPTAGHIGFYGSIIFAIFLVGWGLATFWGPVADRYGRARTLMMTILMYAVFTFLAAFSQNVWELALFRFLAGIGIGGEWAMAGTFVAESWPESRREMGAGYLHSGYYVGILVSAVANYTIGAAFGWRAMFLLGIIPALLVAFIRWKVQEPDRWVKVENTVKTEKKALLSEIFTPELRRRSWGNALLLTVAMVGLWAGTVYLPTAILDLAKTHNIIGTAATHLSSYGVGLLSIFTVIGCLLTPIIARRWGRRTMLGIWLACMIIGVLGTFGLAFYTHSITAFFWFIPILGLGGADFAVFTLWLPEQYPTKVRATAFAFATSVGRFVGAIITFIVGAMVSSMGTLGLPVDFTAIAFVVGLFLLTMSPETKGTQLPD
ncbi:MFS transporter [Sulfobacillus harzensis]|uniref:MFS transporter n=1 Tax=Sulfobacillus harzensis TaxID=2729629 RepID=A0A7Y0L106_9FIRM|nr:MFS transporter [Sulfobacillus harzensis]NMP21321.1 MFS transporter [Sulfobacillus harzensis]